MPSLASYCLAICKDRTAHLKGSSFKIPLRYTSSLFVVEHRGKFWLSILTPPRQSLNSHLVAVYIQFPVSVEPTEISSEQTGGQKAALSFAAFLVSPCLWNSGFLYFMCNQPLGKIQVSNKKKLC